LCPEQHAPLSVRFFEDKPHEAILHTLISTCACSARISTEWRVEMWKVLLPQVPQYLILGKGYAIDPTDMYLVGESVRRGLAKDYEVSLLAGDYHNGPLSVIIPFGIFGMAAFIWLLAAGVRVLYRNYRFSDPALQKVNTFLLSYFVGRSVFFFVGFGSLHSDLSLFLGTLGLSVALNGVRNERSAPVAVPVLAAVVAQGRGFRARSRAAVAPTVSGDLGAVFLERRERKSTPTRNVRSTPRRVAWPLR